MMCRKSAGMPGRRHWAFSLRHEGASVLNRAKGKQNDATSQDMPFEGATSVPRRGGDDMTNQLPLPAQSARSTDTDEWVAVLEFAVTDSTQVFMADAVESMVEHLRCWQPSALWNPDRYAIQVRIPARAPHEALYWAFAYHREAAQAAGLPAAPLVRAEVSTVEELTRSWQEYELADGAPPAPAPEWLLCRELYQAIRHLVAATTEAALAGAVIGFVAAVGGTVEPGEARRRPGVIVVDITMAHGEAYHATADAFSVAGLVIESSLPALVADAQRAAARLRRPHDRASQLVDPA